MRLGSYGMKRNLPKVNEIGAEMETQGLAVFGKNAYNQAGDNCFEIASNLARRFGCIPPASRAETIKEFYSLKAERIWGNSKDNNGHRPEACFVIRTPDDPNRLHIAFEFAGTEYNYGPGTRDGFPVDVRIPLARSGNGDSG